MNIELSLPVDMDNHTTSPVLYEIYKYIQDHIHNKMFTGYIVQNPRVVSYYDIIMSKRITRIDVPVLWKKNNEEAILKNILSVNLVDNDCRGIGGVAFIRRLYKTTKKIIYTVKKTCKQSKRERMAA
jgi:hypothetical protein